MTEHKQEASPRVEAMEPSRRGCLLPRELPNEGNNNGNIELHKEGNNNNNGNIDFFPLYSKYTAATCRLKKKIGKMVSTRSSSIAWNIIVTKVQDQLCIPYNLPAPTSQLLHPGLNICTGQEEVDGEVDETLSKTKYKSDEECLEECGHRSFSTRMSSAKFEDSGDFFYSALLRRPGLALPAASPKFWAEYVQYVNSLGNSTVLGPPRCCICQNKNKKVLFSGEVYWGLHALKKLWVVEQIGLWMLRSKTWKYISKGQEKAREDDSPSRQAQSKWSENFVRDPCFFSDFYCHVTKLNSRHWEKYTGRKRVNRRIGSKAFSRLPLSLGCIGHSSLTFISPRQV